MPDTGERIHVNRRAGSSGEHGVFLDVSPRENPGKGECGGKDQVSCAYFFRAQKSTDRITCLCFFGVFCGF